MTVIVIGEKELLRKLQRLEPRQLEGALLAAGKHVEAKVSPYPPPISETYIRRFKLRDGWRVTPKKSDYAVEIKNIMEYAPYVQGEQQAAIHRGRWKQLKKTALDEMDEIINKVKRQVDRILEGR